MTHMPLGSIEKVETRENRHRRRGMPSMYLDISTKGARTVRFGLSRTWCEKAKMLISAFAYPTDFKFSFAFAYKLIGALPDDANGWKL